jgi:diguanylate cyclase (GGDEF)-like protein/PAS domain S-box-containing protein
MRVSTHPEVGHGHGAGAAWHLLEQAPVPLAVVGWDGALRAANAAFAHLVGLDGDDLVGRTVARVLRTADGEGDVSLGAVAAVASGDGAIAADGDLSRVRRFHRRPTGSFWGRLGVGALEVGSGHPTGDEPAWLVSLEDVTEAVEALRLLHDSETRHRNLVSAAPVGIFLADARGRCTFLNDRCEELVGLTFEEAAAGAWADALHPDDRGFVVGAWAAAVAGRRPFRGEFRLRRPEGDEVWVQSEATAIIGPTGRCEGLLGTMVDVTDTRARLQQLEQQAMHDLLTGLANRALLTRRLELALSNQGRGAIAVLFCDLDGFKAVNDGLGHDAGDALLGVVAERIARVVGADDTVARFGGDEFVVLLEHLEPTHAVALATSAAERLIAAVVQPVPVGGTVASVSASVGIAVSLPTASDDPESLLRAADVAMYQAKLGGKGHWRLYDGELRDRVARHGRLEADLRAGLPSELVVRSEPMFDIVTSEPTAREASAWWQHPRDGLLAPMQFADVAAAAGLDVEIERWVLGEIVRDAAAEQRAGEPVLPVWVTMSSRNVRRGDFAEFIALAVEQHGLEPSRLGISVRHHALTRHPKQVATSIGWLRMIGVRTGIDEFGVEAFSIPLLQQLQVDTIRLHHELVEQLGDDADTFTNVAAVAGVARALGITVVASGVSTEAQVALLGSVGCRAGLGPFFAGAVPAR